MSTLLTDKARHSAPGRFSGVLPNWRGWPLTADPLLWGGLWGGLAQRGLPAAPFIPQVASGLIYSRASRNFSEARCFLGWGVSGGLRSLGDLRWAPCTVTPRAGWLEPQTAVSGLTLSSQQSRSFGLYRGGVPATIPEDKYTFSV